MAKEPEVVDLAPPAAEIPQVPEDLFIAPPEDEYKDPLDEALDKILEDPTQAKALLLRLMAFGGGNQPADMRPKRINGWTDEEGNDLDEAIAPPGIIMYPKMPGRPPIKKGWSRADVEKVWPTVRWRPSNPYAPITGYQGLFWRTPLNKWIETPSIVRDIHEGTVDELEAHKEGVTLYPPAGDSIVTVPSLQDGMRVNRLPMLDPVGAFGADEIYHTVNSVRRFFGMEAERIPEDIFDKPDLELEPAE